MKPLAVIKIAMYPVCALTGERLVGINVLIVQLVVALWSHVLFYDLQC